MDLSMLMQTAQEMGKKAKEQQEELRRRSFDGTAGGGMVKTKMNGEGILTALEIDKSVIDPSDPELLADLVMAAVNDAAKKAVDAKADSMRGLTGGMDLSSLGIDLSKIF